MENKVITGEAYNNLPITGNIGHDLQQMLIRAHEYGLSLNAMRIMTILTLNVKEKQLKKKDKNQMNLLDLLSLEKDLTKEFKFNYSDFLPPGNKNYNSIKSGIEELQRFNTVLEYSVTKKNGQVQHYKMGSTFITAFLMEEKQGFRIAINYYWYRVLINLTDHFNPFLKTMLYNIQSDSTLSFYFFIKGFQYIQAENKKHFINNGMVNEQNWRVRGIRKNLNDFQKLFGIDYKYPSILKRNFLDPIRAELNKYSDLSFNYVLEGKNILIINYPVNHILISEKIETEDVNKIRNAITYKIKKQNFDILSIIIMIELYVKYTYEVVIKATSKKRILTKLEGKEYVDAANKLIDIYIKNNNINIADIGYKDPQGIRNQVRKALKVE